MATNTTQPKMTKETGVFNTNWRKASYYMECLSKVAQATSGFPYKEIWQSVFDDHTWEEREAQIRNSKKRETKKEAKFAPKNLVTPKNVLNLYRDEYRTMCTSTGKEYKNAEFDIAFKALGEADKARLSAKHKTELETYKRAEAEQLALAIQAGEYPEPKPKGFLTEYMVFGGECRKPGNIYLTADESARFATLSIKDQSGILSDAFKRYKENAELMRPIKAIAVADKERYVKELHAWKIRALERQITKLTREGADTASMATELETLRSKPPTTAVLAPVVQAQAQASAEVPAKKARAPRKPATKSGPVPEPEDA
jgi:hypothetical protein